MTLPNPSIATSNLSGHATAFVSNALTNGNLNAPTATFGYLADAQGRRTNVTDASFFMRLNGNIGGTTPMTGNLVGGTTLFNGVAAFGSLNVSPQATLGGVGTLQTTVGNFGIIAPGDGGIGDVELANGLQHRHGGWRVELVAC